MSFRDRLIFDEQRGEYRDGDIRYMMIRPDALMGMILELPAAMRPIALEALGRSITRAGGSSAAHYRSLGAAQADALLAVIQQTAPQLGWGVWQLARNGDTLSLRVRNSPFVAGFGAADFPVCRAVTGMLTAIGRIVLGGDVDVAETSCAAVAGDGECRFRVTSRHEETGP